MEVSVYLHAPAPLTPATGFPIPVKRKLGEHQSRFGSCGEEKNFFRPSDIETRSAVFDPLPQLLHKQALAASGLVKFSGKLRKLCNVVLLQPRQNIVQILENVTQNSHKECSFIPSSEVPISWNVNLSL
jgi:hypothetical protein